MSAIDTPAPGSSLLFFFFITLGFTIFLLFSIQNAKSIEAIEKSKDSGLLNFIYICILILGSYFINTTVSKALCKSKSIQWSNILIATLIPWIVIFFSLYVLLKVFPGWITPFSNTIGYLIISMLGVETTLKDILNDKTKDDPTLADAIANINHNKSNFINQIDIETNKFTDFIKDLADSSIIDLSKAEELVKKEAADKIRLGTEPKGPVTKEPEAEAKGPEPVAKGPETAAPPVPETVAKGPETKVPEAAEAAKGPEKVAPPVPETAAKGPEAEAAKGPETKGPEAVKGHEAVLGGSIKSHRRATTRNGSNKLQRGGDPNKPDVSVNVNIIKLYRLLVIKNVIGQITWYILAGTLVSSVSYNYIINMSCNKSLDEIAADLKNAEIAAEEAAAER